MSVPALVAKTIARIGLRRVAGLALIVTFTASFGTAVAASTPTPEDAVADLNRWRAQTGVAAVTHDLLQTEGCRLHANYYRLNGTFGHYEDPDYPGYTTLGAKAASSSVLAYGNEGRGPKAWENAPYHRTSLLDPRLANTGYWAEFGIGCMGVFGEDNTLTAAVPTAYPYPFDRQTDVPTTFYCNESPNPCTQVPGNDGRTRTGFIPTVLFNGPWARAASARAVAVTLSPAGGSPLPIAVEDGATPQGNYLDGGISIIPVKPLLPGLTYVADASVNLIYSRTSYPVSVRWQFTTAQPGNDMEIDILDPPKSSLHANIQSAAKPNAWLKGPLGARRDVSVRADPEYEDDWIVKEDLGRSTGSWQLCASSGGPGLPVAFGEKCVDFTILLRHKVTVKREGAQLAVKAGTWTAGQNVRIVLKDSKRGCRSYGGYRECGDFLTGRKFRKVVKPDPNASFVLPRWARARGHRVWVSVGVPAVDVEGGRVPAYHWSMRPLARR